MKLIRTAIRELVRVAKEAFVRNYGAKGHRHITSGGGSVSGEEYYKFTVISDTAASVTTVNEYGGDDLTTTSVASGVTIYGRFSTLTVASGEIIAYRN